MLKLVISGDIILAMRLSGKTAWAGAAGLLLAAGMGWCLALSISHRNPILNFSEVVPGRIYRSGQLKAGDLQRMCEKYGVKSILSLRGNEDKAVKNAARRDGLTIVELRLTAKSPPSPRQTELIMKILSGRPFQPGDYADVIRDSINLSPGPSKPDFPVLVHCAQGADRTGYVIALYRVCFEGWSESDARLEMLRFFHLPLRYPALWKSLKGLEPEKYCPQFNPDYKPLAARP